MTLKTDFADGSILWAGSISDTGSYNGIVHQHNLNAGSVSRFHRFPFTMHFSGTSDINASPVEDTTTQTFLGSINIPANKFSGTQGILFVDFMYTYQRTLSGAGSYGCTWRYGIDKYTAAGVYDSDVVAHPVILGSMVSNSSNSNLFENWVSLPFLVSYTSALRTSGFSIRIYGSVDELNSGNGLGQLRVKNIKFLGPRVAT